MQYVIFELLVRKTNYVFISALSRIIFPVCRYVPPSKMMFVINFWVWSFEHFSRSTLNQTFSVFDRESHFDFLSFFEEVNVQLKIKRSSKLLFLSASDDQQACGSKCACQPPQSMSLWEPDPLCLATLIIEFAMQFTVVLRNPDKFSRLFSKPTISPCIHCSVEK